MEKIHKPSQRWPLLIARGLDRAPLAFVLRRDLIPEHIEVRWRIAIVSPSIAVRFVASTFALSVRDVKFFPPGDLPAALKHLECSAQEEQQLLAVLERMRANE